MNDKDLWMMASRAVIGQMHTDTVERVFEALDLTKRRAHEAAYELGAAYGAAQIKVVFNEGYESGYADGANAEEDMYHRGYADGNNVGHAAAYDDGYEQARRDLGECPTLYGDFDVIVDWDACCANARAAGCGE